MQRLNGQDAAFWYGETPTWHMHVGQLMILDGTDVPGFGYESIRELFMSRIQLVPQFRWKVVEAPFHLDRPYWVEDPDLDPHFHIRHTAIPAPGGRAQLEALVSRIMSHKLDRSRPLWEMWVVDGLADGRTAIVYKMHHAVIDGSSGVGMGEVLLDITPEPRDTSNEVSVTTADDKVPSDLELFARGVVNTVVKTPIRAARFMAQTTAALPTLGKALARSDRPSLFFEAPKTRLNGEQTAHRRYTGASLDLDRVKAVKTAFGVKLNDVVLALCSSVIRNYLAERDELPDQSLIAQVPVSIRTDVESKDVGNRVSAISISLATDVDDAGERLRAINASAMNAKQMREALAARSIQGLSHTAHPALVSLAARAYTASGLSGVAAPVSVVISNVPGPPFPLYLAGGKVVSMMPMGPPILGVALNITVFSYIDRIDVGFVTVPELVPDVDTMADALEAALVELEEAAVSVAP